jgi:hypothetical protein
MAGTATLRDVEKRAPEPAWGAGLSNEVLPIRRMGITLRGMTTISLKLPEPLADRLAAEARSRRKPKSALVREFIETGLSGAVGRKRPSFHALAKDKSARFSGPRDLATNLKHIEGFGR